MKFSILKFIVFLSINEEEIEREWTRDVESGNFFALCSWISLMIRKSAPLYLYHRFVFHH